MASQLGNPEQPSVKTATPTVRLGYIGENGQPNQGHPVFALDPLWFKPVTNENIDNCAYLSLCFPLASCRHDQPDASQVLIESARRNSRIEVWAAWVASSGTTQKIGGQARVDGQTFALNDP